MSYDKLDEAIVSAIRNGTDRFYLINAAVESLAAPHCLSENPFRVTDRRLQALSKRGVIQFWRGKWRIRPAPGGDGD